MTVRRLQTQKVLPRRADGPSNLHHAVDDFGDRLLIWLCQ
jgi:hypothetical protein